MPLEEDSNSRPINNVGDFDSRRSSKRQKRGGDASSPAANPVPSPPALTKWYKCDICDKSYASPQALGGHKTIHRSKPPPAAAAVQGSCASVGGPHACSKCGACFSSGQALGGHQRKHYRGGDANSSASVVTSEIRRGGDDDNEEEVRGPNLDLRIGPPSPCTEMDLTLRL